MTPKERAIIEKLQALIKSTPYEGEKQTALNVLKNYCLKHNINEAELATETEKMFTYIVNGSPEATNVITDYDLFSVIARHYFNRQGKDFYQMGFTYRLEGNKTILKMNLTPSDFVNLIAEYEFYLKAYKKSYKKEFKDFQFRFYRAFLMQQDLLFKPKEKSEEEYSEEAIEEEMDVIKQSKKIDKVHYFKQIE